MREHKTVSINIYLHIISIYFHKMKKLLLLLAVSIGFSLAATAQGVILPPFGTQVVNADFNNGGNPFTDGTIVALQCADISGGVGRYFNGAAAKSETFSYANLYRVVTTGNGRFKLQSLQNEAEYVGRENNLVAMKNSDEAETFTAAIATNGWANADRPAGATAGTNTVRFTTTDNNFLNANNTNNVPRYFNGIYGLSIWYVFTFTEEEINIIHAGLENVDVTLKFIGIEDEELSTTFTYYAPHVDVNRVLSAPALSVPEFFVATGGVVEDNKEISADNTTFTVNGTWNYPFTLNRVFRADLRKGGMAQNQQCTKWTVQDNDTVSTRENANAEQFDPRNLFYLRGHGYNSDNRLIVTLHTIAHSDEAGFHCNSANSSLGTFTNEPTMWVVKTNSQETATDKGISLQHPDAVNAHVNDISGHLGVWNAANLSQNDGGSFIRFFDLTDSDFATTQYEHNGTVYTLQAADLNRAKENPTSENLREVFSFIRTVTVNMKYNGRVLSTVEFSGMTGDEYTVNPPDFFADEPMTVQISANDEVVDYNLTQLELPFKHTETTDNMIYQGVQIHKGWKNSAINVGGNSKIRFTWTFSLADSNTMVESEPEDITTNGLADTQLWAFVGNIADGFKIYNLAAGTDKWLYSDGTHAKVGSTEENSIWRPCLTDNLTDRPSSTYCCFTADGSNYVNMNTGDGANATTLSFWQSPDAGSSCWFIAPSEPMLATAGGYCLEEYNGPENAVGEVFHNGFDIAGAQAAVAAATANKYDLEAAEALRDMIARYEGTVTSTELVPNGYYRIKNILYTDEYLYTSATDSKIYSKLYDTKRNEYRQDYHTIFKFEPVAGQTDRYYLQSQGLYVGHVHGTGDDTKYGPVQVSDVADRGEYRLVKMNHDDMPAIPTCAAFAICDASQSDYNYLHQGGDANSGSYEITAWRQFAHGSHFYVIKAEHVDVELTHELDNMMVGFGYFPFPVHAADKESTKLYYICESRHKDTNEAVLTYCGVDTVPANTAFMVGSKNGGTALLTIADVNGASVARSARGVRRVVSASETNTMTDSLRITDAWTGSSWTKIGAESVPAQISALSGVNAANVRYMDRPMKFVGAGELTVDFEYSSGNHRLDICGVAILDAEGNIVSGDFHTGFSGNNKSNQVYTVKVAHGGTYTLRYYAWNADNAMETNGNIELFYVADENVLHGHVRQLQSTAGDYHVGMTSSGIGFVKTPASATVNGNYVYIPAGNLSDELGAADELPLIHRSNTTSIVEVNGEPAVPAMNVIYDLQGRRLSAPVKGINIINGRKVLVK